MTAGLLVYFFNVVRSLRGGARAPANPWGAPSLEWATSSPPPAYNFLPSPTVSGREPLWQSPESQPVVVGLRADCRDVLVTRVMDAEPDHRKDFPGPTIWPFLAALTTSVTYLGSIFTPWAIVWGAGPIAATLICWAWPRRGKSPRELEEDVERGRATPLELLQ
jgi:cytochrome c oxidase subunit I+III